MQPFGLHSKRVLIDDQLKDATVLIEDGLIKVVHVGSRDDEIVPIEDLGNSVIMPGLVDSHVHINEPGRAEWEGFDTATKAAAAGGVTTLIEMPLNSNPVTTTRKAFEEKVKATKDKLHVNCGFWGGIVPENLNDLDDLIDYFIYKSKYKN